MPAGTRDLEATDFFRKAHKTISGVVERHHDLTILELRRPEAGIEGREGGVAVSKGEGLIAEPLADLTLLRCVDLGALVLIGQVVRSNQARVRNLFRCDELLLAHERTVLVLESVLSVIIVVRLELDDEEGDVSSADVAAPLGSHSRQAIGIDLVGDADVGLALEPEYAVDCILGGGTEHRIVHNHRLVHIVDLGIGGVGEIHVGTVLQKLFTHPGFDDGAAPAGIYDAHGHIQGLRQPGGEEIANRRETRARGGVAHLPLPFRVKLRFGGAGLPDCDVADALVLGGERNLIEAALDRGAHTAAERHLHIALPGAEPYLSYEDVRGADGLASAGCLDHLRLETGPKSLQHHLPMPFGIGPGTYRRLLGPRRRDVDGSTRRSRAPDADLGVLLEDHIIPYHRGECQVPGLKGEGKQQQCRCKQCFFHRKR